VYYVEAGVCPVLRLGSSVRFIEGLGF